MLLGLAIRVQNTRLKSASLRALAWQTSCTKTAEQLMSKINQASDFRARHGEPKLLILPNAWDACSAMLMHRLGAEAIATTSAGVAWALGYPDGDAVPIDLHAACIRQIARVVSCPVSADVEGGYSDDLQQAADNILRLVDAVPPIRCVARLRR